MLLEKVRACRSRSYRRTLVLRSGDQQTICEILHVAHVKIKLALRRGAAATSWKCSAPKAYELLGHESVPLRWESVSLGNPLERLAMSGRES